ncbi:MAG: hypothetical protein WAW69_17195 [Polaromonas sp.]
MITGVSFVGIDATLREKKKLCCLPACLLAEYRSAYPWGNVFLAFLPIQKERLLLFI